MSDLISREEVLKHTMEDNPFYKYVLVESINSIPSADILEHAREIKDYCEGFPNCEGCRFYNGTIHFRCDFHVCPNEWNLPEGEKV